MFGLLPVFSGLMGAAGVALAAAAAHASADPRLPAAAQMLMVHAGAVLAVCAFARGTERRKLWGLGAALLVAGPALFSADMAARALAGASRLFPMAAPIGGSLTILGWLCVAFAALADRFRQN
ncbi:MAG: DUF423 domain-containing protein [Hyphomicrobiales bacterium]|nr:DUF423 domain-containing protein [Hyphomicrobiales bacterium]